MYQKTHSPHPLLIKDRCPCCLTDLTVDLIDVPEEKANPALADDTLIQMTCCGKYFHKKCIFDTLQSVLGMWSCPHCRRPRGRFELNAFAQVTSEHDERHFVVLLLSEYMAALTDRSWSTAIYQEIKKMVAELPDLTPAVKQKFLRKMMMENRIPKKNLTRAALAPFVSELDEAGIKNRILKANHKLLSKVAFITGLMKNFPENKSFASIASAIEHQQFFDAYEEFADRNFQVVQEAARSLQQATPAQMLEANQLAEQMLRAFREQHHNIGFRDINFREVQWPQLLTEQSIIPKPALPAPQRLAVDAMEYKVWILATIMLIIAIIKAYRDGMIDGHGMKIWYLLVFGIYFYSQRNEVRRVFFPPR